MTELTAAPITDPAMPILEASATLVAAAAAPAMIWGMEMSSNRPFLGAMAMVWPMEWFSCTPLLSDAGVMTRVRGASVYSVVIRGPPGSFSAATGCSALRVPSRCEPEMDSPATPSTHQSAKLLLRLIE